MHVAVLAPVEIAQYAKVSGTDFTKCCLGIAAAKLVC